jgi:hypothetical protein
MATNKNIYDLVTLSKTSVDSADYLEVANQTTRKSYKILIATLFPSLVTAGTSSESLWSSITNKNQLNFKGIKSGDTGLLTVTTDTNNIVLTALEAGIDLSLCDNTTSLFLSGVDFTGSVTGENSVINGGTGLSTIAKGAVLYASAANTIEATASTINGQILVYNSTTGLPVWSSIDAGKNLTLDTSVAGVLTLDASLGTMAANLDMVSYHVDLTDGACFISGDGSAEGLTVDNDGKVYIGPNSKKAFDDTLTIKGGIRFTNTDAPTIKPAVTVSSVAGQPVTIEGGGSATGAAGNLILKGGSTSGTAAAGHVIITGGEDGGGNTNGTIQLKTYTGTGAVAGLTVADDGQDVTVNTGDLIITQPLKGIVHSGGGIVTQTSGSPSHTDGVEMNTTSGVITLAAVALAATTNAEFTFTNSTISGGSVILLTMQDANTTNNVQLACALVSLTSGSCVISVVNPHSSGATSATASKIHFLVIN